MSNKLLKETDTKKKKSTAAKHNQSEKTAKAEVKNTKSEPKSDPGDNKIVTKYDKKVQKRKQEQLKAAKEKKITAIVAIVVAVVAIVSAAIAAWTNYDKVHNKYVAVDNDSISQIEFDFYYNIAKESMLSQTLYENLTYKNYFESYMGYDSSKADKNQTYSSTDNTWYDYFGNNAVTTIKEHKALLKDAENNSFTYEDADKDYEAFCADITEAAKNANQSVADYYKATFGSHATQSNLKNYIYEYLKANAYQEKLSTDLAASDSEVTDYYNSNKETYDTVNYRSFVFTAEDTTSDALKAEAKAKAESMMNAVTDEASFAELCKKNASTEDSEKYSDDSASLSVDTTKATMDTALSAWMFDESRTAGNKDVVENADKGTYTVAYFISRQKPDTTDETIKSTLFSQKYNELIKGYTDSMTFDNVKNRIKTMEN